MSKKEKSTENQEEVQAPQTNVEESTGPIQEQVLEQITVDPELEVEAEEIVGAQEKEQVIKEPEEIVVYSKEFPKGLFPGNTAMCQREIAKEAGSHLLGTGIWKIDTQTREDGVVVQKVLVATL